MHWLDRLAKRARQKRMRVDFKSDGIGVSGRNLSWLAEPRFVAAWEAATAANGAGWGGKVPDIRWRVHTCIWAAQQALRTEGDFVECGVHTGILSVAIAHYLDFANINRTFFLFDTFEGIPSGELTGKEADMARDHNQRLYFDCFDIARRNFSPWPNAKLIRGQLPGTLDALGERKVAYLSIDLNSATYEMAAIERLWDHLSPGAVVVLDDYAFSNYEDQFQAWNAFAAKVGRPIMLSPTGQGIICV